MATNPYVFVVGCPRSGTTLLQRMLDAHPDIAIIHEPGWRLPRSFEQRQGLTPEGLVTSQLVSGLLERRRVSRNLKLTRAELETLIGSGEGVPYSTFFTGIFDRYGKACRKSLVGEKSPRYVAHLPTLHALWPLAKYVHLIRDGRDVCLSALHWRPESRAVTTQKRTSVGRLPTWREDPVTTAALWWEWHVRLGREAGNSLGSDLYYEVRYERLVARPAEESAALCAFLELRYDDAMLRFHEGRTTPDPGLDAKQAWQPITPGLRDWSSQMSPAEVERFEAAAGDLLEELGYPRACPRPRDEALEHAARIRSIFTEDVRARRREPLPSHWPST